MALVRYLNPWKFRHQEAQRRIAELRRRDGDCCTRCKRPMRFDLPDGHDQAVKVEHILHAVNGGSGELQNLCLTHRRCNPAGADATVEVTERVRRKNEAALLSRSRQKRRA